MRKNIEELKKKLSEKSKECVLYRNKYVRVLEENDELKEEIIKLSDSKPFKLPFLDATKDALFCVEHSKVSRQKSVESPSKEDLQKCMTPSEESVVEDSTNFSSRFMPNVVFEAKGDLSSISDVLDTSVFRYGYAHFKVNSSGDNFSVLTPFEFECIRIKKVSIYEAIPELVPKGMVYDKEIDSIKEDVVKFSTFSK